MGSTIRYDITRTDHAAVESFIDRLSELGVEDWCSVAALASADRSRETECATLEQLVRRHGLDLGAWMVKDDVETAFQYGVGSSRLAMNRRQREATQIARDIARTAAVAVLLRRLLAPEDFESLYRPFATLAARSAPTATDPNRRDGERTGCINPSPPVHVAIPRADARSRSACRRSTSHGGCAT